MFNSFNRGAAIAAVALIASAGTANAAEFVTNGTFATPNVGGSGGYSNTQPVPGWQDLAEAAPTYYVEVGNSGTYGLPCISVGCQNAEVNNTTFGDLVQTVTGLIVGDHYTFSLNYGDRNGGGAQEMNIYVGGQYVDTGSGPGEGLGWLFGSYDIVANATSEVIEFQGVDVGGTPGYGNEITNVSLTGPAVPEPATWAMMLAGFAMIGAALRRRSTAVRVSFG